MSPSPFFDNGDAPAPTPETLLAAVATYLDRHDRDFQSEIREILASLAQEEADD